MHTFEAETARGKTTDAGEITLHPGAMVGGRVMDETGGPVEGVLVFLVPYSDLRGHTDEEEGQTGDLLGGVEDVTDRWPSTTSGPDGIFRIDCVPADRWNLWAGGGRWRYTFKGPMSLFAGDDRDDVVLVLAELRDEDVIAGVVLDPEGMPVPDVQVDGVFQARRVCGALSTLSDERGRFRLRLCFAVSHDLTALHPEFTWFAVTKEDVAAGTHDVELRFRAAEKITLRVHDPAGNPIEDYRVEVLETTPGTIMANRPRAMDGPSGTSRGGGPLPDRHAPEGVSNVSVPARPVDLDVSAPGYETLTVESITAAQASVPLDCTLVPLPVIRGRVLAGGRPVEGARVYLMSIPVEGRLVVNDGMPSLVDRRVRETTTTDRDGRFAVPLRHDAERSGRDHVRSDSIRLWVRADGWAPLLSAPLPARPAEGGEDSLLQLSSGGTIEGRVLDPGSSSVAGTCVAVTNGDGHPSHIFVKEDGRFRFEPLAPGDWFVRVVDPEQDLHRGRGARVDGFLEFPVSCCVLEGETTIHDLELAPFRQRLEGLLSVPGANAEEWEATLLPIDFHAYLNRTSPVNLDRQGHFAIEVGGEGVYRLLLKEATDDRGRRLRIMDTIDLQGGHVAWQLELELAFLRVTNAPGTLYHVCRGEGDLLIYRELRPEDGTVPPTPVPAGRSWLTREYPGRASSVFDPSIRPVLQELDLLPGTSHTVDLR